MSFRLRAGPRPRQRARAIQPAPPALPRRRSSEHWRIEVRLRRRRRDDGATGGSFVLARGDPKPRRFEKAAAGAQNVSVQALEAKPAVLIGRSSELALLPPFLESLAGGAGGDPLRGRGRNGKDEPVVGRGNGGA